jgi:UDP-N-acetylglucosamine--N-acetylmuramyl-(pentapeptide) pyrophosphoryl-undecaprenol N-acetylglucosamine transferase
MRRVVLAGGGTGGHLFPGLAVAEALEEAYPGVVVTFVGTARGLETRAVPRTGRALELVDVQPLKGRGPLGALAGLARVPRALFAARRLLARLDPEVVVGLGGYAAGPVVLAASLGGRPTALLEQNALPGLTNRLLARRVTRAYLTFPESADRFPKGVARVVGNPVRRAFTEDAGGPADPPEVLVLGGSQGARTLNRVVPEALALLAAKGIRPKALCQTGAADEASVRARALELGLAVEVAAFVDDVAAAYRRAAVVVCRAGATTLAEICAVGRPSILVPYPFAADDHQTKNALALEAAGASVQLADRDLTPDRLADALADLLADPARRARMSEAAKARGRPDAAREIARDLPSLVG